MQTVVNVLLVASGALMLLAAQAVLQKSRRAEMSLRALAALAVGAGGLTCVAQGIGLVPPPWSHVLLPLGVALWVLHAARRHQGQPMRRASDWAALTDEATP